MLNKYIADLIGIDCYFLEKPTPQRPDRLEDAGFITSNKRTTTNNSIIDGVNISFILLLWQNEFSFYATQQHHSSSLFPLTQISVPGDLIAYVTPLKKYKIKNGSADNCSTHFQELVIHPYSTITSKPAYITFKH